MTSGSVIPLDLPYCMKEGAWDGVMVHIFFLRGELLNGRKKIPFRWLDSLIFTLPYSFFLLT